MTSTVPRVGLWERTSVSRRVRLSLTPKSKTNSTSVTMNSRNCSVWRLSIAMSKLSANGVPVFVVSEEEPVYVELQSILQWQNELRYWYAQAIWLGAYFVPKLGQC